MKPSIPRGTRDFSPIEMAKRNYIFDTIRKVFLSFGYQPIETPAMENIETLTGKYGEEGDQLLYKILNSRQFEAKNKEEIKKAFDSSLEKSINSPLLTEKALRYDLTVPFARYVVQHQHEITFPFKRYQMQPVWRADKPQKGRYREFYQCDADVVGSDSLLNEVELMQIIAEVFLKLNLPITIKFNNRKLLTGISEVFGVQDKLIDLIVAIDKYEKIGDKIYEELKEKGFSEEVVKKVRDFIAVALNSDFGKDRFSKVEEMLSGSDTARKGFEEINSVMNSFVKISNDYSVFHGKGFVVHDLTLARGLNYYTGAIFEVKANAGTLSSSICGGGRYDNLTGIFGLPGISGVGISFGIDRIFDVMNELNLFEGVDSSKTSTQILLAHFGEKEREHCLQAALLLRKEGIATEIYPDVTKKIAKQFDYANKKGIPYVLVVGEEEMKTKQYSLKNMLNGEQQKLSLEEVVSTLKV